MDDEVRRRVDAAGLGLIGFAVASGLTHVLWLVATTVAIVLRARAGESIVSAILASAYGLVLPLVGIASALVVLAGGLRLRAARSPMLVYASAALAMMPCCSSWCCAVGLVVGVGVILVLQDDRVRAAFAEA